MPWHWFCRRRFDPVIARIDERVANWVQIPGSHTEGMEVLRYGEGAWFEPHIDYNEDQAGHRVATVLLYLNSKWSCHQLRVKQVC